MGCRMVVIVKGLSAWGIPTLIAIHGRREALVPIVNGAHPTHFHHGMGKPAESGRRPHHWLFKYSLLRFLLMPSPIARRCAAR
jgi:hypothetical protein